MRTNEERVRLIHARTMDIKRKQQKRKQYFIDAVFLAATFLIITILSIQMPVLMKNAVGEQVLHVSGTASLVGSHEALGYILMGILSFLLGVCVTVLLFRLHQRGEWKENLNEKENSDSEGKNNEF